jgi:hypothetical protein
VLIAPLLKVRHDERVLINKDTVATFLEEDGSAVCLRAASGLGSAIRVRLTPESRHAVLFLDRVGAYLTQVFASIQRGEETVDIHWTRCMRRYEDGLDVSMRTVHSDELKDHGPDRSRFGDELVGLSAHLAGSRCSKLTTEV